MADILCAFDESGTHAGSSTVCVAGYIFLQQNLEAFENAWSNVLSWHHLEHPLPYFHMTECAHGRKSFEGISDKHRILVMSQLIGVIKRYTVQGLAGTVSVEEYNRILAGHPVYTDPYVLVAHLVFAGVAGWIAKQQVEIERADYIFEAGHASQSETDRVIGHFGRKFSKDYRYVSHRFCPKVGNPVVQAADFLAWHWHKDRRSLAEGRARRKDLASLLLHPHNTAHFHTDRLELLAQATESLTSAILD